MACTITEVIDLMQREVFASRLRQLRKNQGLTQFALADALGVSRACLRNWELSETTPPLETLVSIVLYFHVTSDFLLGLEERNCIQVDFLSTRAVNAISNLVQVMQEENNAPGSKATSW